MPFGFVLRSKTKVSPGDTSRSSVWFPLIQSSPEDMAASATDHVRLGELQAELESARAERERLEADWLEASEALEG